MRHSTISNSFRWVPHRRFGATTTLTMTAAADDCSTQFCRAKTPMLVMDMSGNDQLVSRTCGEELAAKARSNSFTIFSSGWLSTSFSADDVSLDDSVNSTAYYQPSDFNPANWIKAMDGPTFGFAVVALTTAVTHPLLFVAGALTAFGTARAANAVGYGCFNEDSLCWKACENGETYSGDLKEEDEAAAAQEEAGSKASSSSSQDTPEPAQPLEMLQSPSEYEMPEHWVDLQFPKLEKFLITDEFVGLSVVEFFRVFFGDDAPYNFRAFQEKRGDIDIQYGPWKDLPHGSILSMHPDARLVNDCQPHSFQQRTLSFKAKTNSFFGPPYASTTKTQRILILSKRLAVLESKTTLGDIPFSDRFFVMERWIIEATKDGELYTARASVSCQVFFTDSCPFETQIRTKSTAALHDVTGAWCAMAQEALKLTEATKLDREQRSMNGSELFNENDQGIEVEHLARGRSESEPDLPAATRLQSFRRSLSTMNQRAMSTMSKRRSLSYVRARKETV